MAKYRQISTQLWIDEKFSNISPQAKLLFLWTFTNPKAGSSGLFSFNDDVCQNETGLSDRELHNSLKELTKTDRLRYDEKNNIIWVVNQFKHVPKSEKIIEAIIREMDNLPKSILVDAFRDKYAVQFIPYGIEADPAKTSPTNEIVNNKAEKARNLMRQFTSSWFREYQVKMLIKSYYYKRLYDLLADYEEKDISEAMKIFFDSTNRFVVEGSHSFGIFLSSIDKYIAEVKKPRSGRARKR